MLIDQRRHRIAVARSAKTPGPVFRRDDAADRWQVGPPAFAQFLEAGKARHGAGDFRALRPRRPARFGLDFAAGQVAFDQEGFDAGDLHWCPDSEIRLISISAPSEFRNLRATSSL